MSPKEKLNSKLQKGFHICVGLDTDINKIPPHLRNNENAILDFNKAIIDNTHDIAAAYKINFAFYEKEGQKGFSLLSKTLRLIPDNILVIGDAKRGDIGNTSSMYAQSMFEHFKLDSSTLNPYMGYDSLSPFIDYRENIHFILALTSNPGSFDFEKLELTTGRKVYQEVIAKVNEWNKNNNLGIVFGATNLDELKDNISDFGDLFVLLPGVGAQGGDLEGIVSAFKENKNNNYLINVSRALIYADSTEKFAEVGRNILENYNKIINEI
ncbi:MAG: orotidine-5'-phosphate decarboxylase [Bacteroidetes bacterium]|nr:orotidine-5'-phosphate decarboxylase [Bacteroidota bacterium]MBU1116290.1 orotidine-5'-phosphate decarboxylase [Bacteroidota bacterium]MBU1797138.1 orotidine-5'-phosphate decarboxylase [Bacteroidota bacterium]